MIWLGTNPKNLQCAASDSCQSLLLLKMTERVVTGPYSSIQQVAKLLLLRVRLACETPFAWCHQTNVLFHLIYLRGAILKISNARYGPNSENMHHIIINPVWVWVYGLCWNEIVMSYWHHFVMWIPVVVIIIHVLRPVIVLELFWLEGPPPGTMKISRMDLSCTTPAC